MAVRIALVGAGRIGRIHAENLAFRVPEADFVAVTDVNRASAELCARDYGVPSVAADYSELLSREDIDAVAVCSSTDTHAGYIAEAAQAGKHIFCEKPIALDLTATDRALEAVEQHGVGLMVGFNRRFHPNFKRVRDIVASGGIGRPHLVRITSRDPRPPRIEYVKVSGGIFLDMTIHDFDMARYVTGSEVTEVFATGAVLIDPDIGEAGDVDTAVVVMRYTDGAICTIDNSRQAVYGYDQRVEVFGSDGMTNCENTYPDSVVTSTRDGVRSSLPYFDLLDIYRETYVEEMRAFLLAVESGTTPPITGKDGRIPLVMGIAATRSLHEGRPVKLSEIA
jgi:myo-inositol 2-dehydrogenase / D-chiro-inositol 1-dehydrogenase